MAGDATRTPRRAAAMAGLVLALALGGCTVSTPLRSGANAPGSVLRDNAITLDLRRPPTRADLGFPEGSNQRAYQQEAGRPPIATTVELPTGTLRAPAIVVGADGDDHTPAGIRNPRPPQRIVVERVFGTAAEAADSLTADSALLGLDRGDLEALLFRVARGQPPAMPQRGTLDGLVRDWLAASVDVIGHEDPSVQVNYTFTVNEFHNPAIDAVVHDGVFGIDLTRRPSRADLALRDTYSLAVVKAPPSGTLTARLRLPGGVLERRVTSVTSSTTAPGVDDPAGTGPPRRTDLALVASGVADAERMLRADAPLLGLDPAAVDAIFAGAPGTHVARTLPGRGGPAYDVAAVVQVTLGQPGAFAAALTYRFTYR
jgi:hypothetical protein